MKSIVKLTTFFSPWELEQAVADFVAYYNTVRYHESRDNLTPADVYFERQEEVLTQCDIIKQQTFLQRRRHNLRIEDYSVEENYASPLFLAFFCSKDFDDIQNDNHTQISC